MLRQYLLFTREKDGREMIPRASDKCTFLKSFLETMREERERKFIYKLSLEVKVSRDL